MGCSYCDEHDMVAQAPWLKNPSTRRAVMPMQEQLSLFDPKENGIFNDRRES